MAIEHLEPEEIETRKAGGVDKSCINHVNHISVLAAYHIKKPDNCRTMMSHIFLQVQRISNLEN